MKHQKSGCRLGALLLSAVMALSAGAVWQGFRAKAAGGEATALSIETGPAVKGSDGRFSFPELVLRVPDGAQVKSVTVQFSSAVASADNISLPPSGGFVQLAGSKSGNVAINASGKSAQEWTQYLRDNLRVTLAGSEMKRLRLIASYSEATDIYDYNAETGHYYQVVRSGNSWKAAMADADQRKYLGMQGYLVTITTQEENDFVASLIPNINTWMGGSCDPAYTKDPDSGNATPGRWYWVSGPEGIADSGKPLLFWEGVCNTSTPNDPANSRNGCWLNWIETSRGWPVNGPDHGGAPGIAGAEPYLSSYRENGSLGWNDLSDTQTMVYVVEYGGMPGDKVESDDCAKEEVNLDPSGKALSTSASDITVGEEPKVVSKANGSPVEAVVYTYYRRADDGSWKPVAAPEHVGEYRVVSAKDGYQGDSDTFQVLPKDISVAPTPAADGTYTKVYDGTNGYGGDISLSGLPEGADVQLRCTATFNSKDVATADTLTLTGLSLTGDDAGDYTLTGLADGKIEVPGSITPRPLAVAPTFAVSESWAGVPLPHDYGHTAVEYDPDGSWGSMLGEGDALADTLGEPAYSCRAGKVELDRQAPLAGSYTLAVTFPDATELARQNYEITCATLPLLIKERHPPTVRPQGEQQGPLVPNAVTEGAGGTVHAVVADAVVERVRPSGSLSRLEVLGLLMDRYQVDSALPDGALTYSAATIFKGGAAADAVDLTRPGSYLLSVTATDSLGDTATIFLTYTLVEEPVEPTPTPPDGGEGDPSGGEPDAPETPTPPPSGGQATVESDSDSGHQNPIITGDGAIAPSDSGLLLAGASLAALSLGGVALFGGRKGRRYKR
ncbi:hypothetical protein KQI11_08715 [Acetanaerobacterium sp. MSJ-12]|uniref:YDG domain-containing protein n=1 Tax=Acetanaerobacterium sp. MSJ-12 TaxID=2841535 RepID=UPI001C0EB3D4|nr:hypothetical protein [Acetanaerobacterium sp. MSJ-12]